MSPRSTVILDRNKIYEDRKTKTDKQIEFENWVTKTILVRQCWRRVDWVHPVFRHSEKRISPLPNYKVKEVPRILPTESWLNDQRTAKHEVEIKEWFELVEYWKPFYWFYDKKYETKYPS